MKLPGFLSFFATLSPLRLAVWVGIPALLAAGALWVNHWRVTAARVPELERDLTTLEHAYDAYRQAQAAENVRAAGISQGLAHELATLKARAAAPVPAIRLCPSAASSPDRVPATGPATGRSDATVAGAGDVHDSAARDIGPATFALTDDADQLLAHYRALQTWARALPACEPIS